MVPPGHRPLWSLPFSTSVWPGRCCNGDCPPRRGIQCDAWVRSYICVCLQHPPRRCPVHRILILFLFLLIRRYPGEGPPSASSIPEYGTPGYVEPFPVGMRVTVIPGSGTDAHPHQMAMFTGKVVSRLDEEYYAVYEFGKERAAKKGKRVHRDKITEWTEPGSSSGDRGLRYSDLSEKDRDKLRVQAGHEVPPQI